MIKVYKLCEKLWVSFLINLGQRVILFIKYKTFYKNIINDLDKTMGCPRGVTVK